jgi:putative FmdB family regulatory protein
MPFYEYRCEECGESFEVLRPVTRRDDPAVCPNCGGHDVERRLTLFATANSSGTDAGRSSCQFSGGG